MGDLLWRPWHAVRKYQPSPPPSSSLSLVGARGLSRKGSAVWEGALETGLRLLPTRACQWFMHLFIGQILIKSLLCTEHYTNHEEAQEGRKGHNKALCLPSWSPGAQGSLGVTRQLPFLAGPRKWELESSPRGGPCSLASQMGKLRPGGRVLPVSTPPAYQLTVLNPLFKKCVSLSYQESCCFKVVHFCLSQDPRPPSSPVRWDMGCAPHRGWA